MLNKNFFAEQVISYFTVNLCFKTRIIVCSYLAVALSHV